MVREAAAREGHARLLGDAGDEGGSESGGPRAYNVGRGGGEVGTVSGGGGGEEEGEEEVYEVKKEKKKDEGEGDEVGEKK